MVDCRECIKFGARHPLVSKTHIIAIIISISLFLSAGWTVRKGGGQKQIICTILHVQYFKSAIQARVYAVAPAMNRGACLHIYTSSRSKTNHRLVCNGKINFETCVDYHIFAVYLD